MFEWQVFIEGAMQLFNFDVAWLIAAGVIFGVITGAIPGFTTVLAMIVMFPYSYTLEPLNAIVFMTAIFLGGNFGGSISSILLNIPGAPQNFAACMDGYPMTQQGKANEALGAALGASTFGSFIGAVILLIVMVPLGALALRFGPSEMFMVIVVGLTIIASLSSGNLIRGLLAGCFGMLLGTVGMSITGHFRGTFGLVELYDGIPLMPTLIGFIGLSELLFLVEKEKIVGEGIVFKPDLKKLFYGIKRGLTSWINIIRSSILGTVIGILPGAGAMFATIVSYNESRRYSKNPENYGKGEIEGIVAAEAANNASQGGSYAILLALGLPGGQATAVLYGALLVQGVIAGPRFVGEYPDMAYGIIVSMVLATIALLFFGGIISFFLSRVVTIPTSTLVPILIIATVIGTYAARMQSVDVWIMIVLGIIGYLMRRYDFPIMATVLGIILGSIAETHFVRMIQAFPNIWVVFQRPLFTGLFLLALASFLFPIIREHLAARKKNNDNRQNNN